MSFTSSLRSPFSWLRSLFLDPGTGHTGDAPAAGRHHQFATIPISVKSFKTFEGRTFVAFWFCVTQGGTHPSRKERIMFGKLEP